jgi:tRNA(adenine34) deaminase
MQAIEAATRKIGDWRLDEATLYVTLEPCAMCMGFANLSRIERIVYGAPSPLFGYHLDREGNSALYTRQVKNVTEGVLADEATTILKQFFKQKRKKSA